MRILVVLAISGTILLSGCAWVKPSLDSQQVIYQPIEAVSQCRKMGVARVKTLSKVVIVPRSADLVRNELITLAKNEAVIMRGDTVAADGPVQDGAQAFGVYRCR